MKHIQVECYHCHYCLEAVLHRIITPNLCSGGNAGIVIIAHSEYRNTDGACVLVETESQECGNLSVAEFRTLMVLGQTLLVSLKVQVLMDMYHVAG